MGGMRRVSYERVVGFRTKQDHKSTFKKHSGPIVTLVIRPYPSIISINAISQHVSQNVQLNLVFALALESSGCKPSPNP